MRRHPLTVSRAQPAFEWTKHRVPQKKEGAEHDPCGQRIVEPNRIVWLDRMGPKLRSGVGGAFDHFGIHVAHALFRLSRRPCDHRSNPYRWGSTIWSVRRAPWQGGGCCGSCHGKRSCPRRISRGRFACTCLRGGGSEPSHSIRICDRPARDSSIRRTCRICGRLPHAHRPVQCQCWGYTFRVRVGCRLPC